MLFKISADFAHTFNLNESVSSHLRASHHVFVSCPSLAHVQSGVGVQLAIAWEQKRRYRIARKFRGVKFSRKLIRRSFRDFIFADPYQD